MAVWSLATAGVAGPDGTLTRVDLARGGTLLLVEDHRVPLVSVRFAVPIGRASSVWDHEAEIVWMSQRVDSRLDVIEQLALLPADLSIGVGEDPVSLAATWLRGANRRSRSQGDGSTTPCAWPCSTPGTAATRAWTGPRTQR